MPPAFWSANTAYIVGNRAVDNNGNIQQVTVPGTSGANAPVWSQALGGFTPDNGITWECVGFETLQVAIKPIGPAKQTPLDAIIVSLGAQDAGKVVLLNPSGQLDPSMGGGGGGGGSFSSITSGTNDSATMTVGTGAEIISSGGGIINATEINGIPITGTLTHAGQIPISQPGNTSAVWADPLVQGIQAEGTSASTVSPVLVAGKNSSGNLADLPIVNVGSPASPAVNVNVTNTLTLSGTVAVSNFPVTQPISGTITADQGGSWTVASTQSGTWTVGISSGQIIAVTNTGTFATQATQSGTWNIGTLTSITNPVTVSGTVTANQGTNPWTSNIEASGVPLTATLAGSPAVEALNVYVVNATSSSVTQGTVPWVDNISQIGGASFSLGQQLAGASLPIVLTAAQLSTLTPLSTVAVTQSTSPWVVSLTSTAITGTVAVTQSGSWTVAATQFGNWSTRTEDGVGNPISSTAESSPATTGLNVHIQNASAISVQDSTAEGFLATLAGTVVTTGSPPHTSVDVANAGTFAVQAVPGVPTTGSTLRTNITTSSSGSTVLVSGSGSTTIRLWRLIVSVNGATNIEILDNASPPNVIGPFYLTAAGAAIVFDISGEPWFITGAGASLEINSSSAVSLTVDTWTTQS